MNNIRHNVRKALVLLNTAGVRYAVIDEEGKVYGDASLLRTSKKLSVNKRFGYDYGERTQYVRSFLDNVKPNSMVEVPIGNFTRKTLSPCITAHASGTWGAGTYAIETDKKKNVIIVYRF